MKKYLLFLFLLPFLQFVNGQEYSIKVYTGQTVNTCSGNVVDGGGSGGGYSINENYTMTIHSNDPINTHIKLYFDVFSIDVSDTLYIYDGPNTSSTLIGAYNNNNTLFLYPVTATLTNGTGALTLKFKSDGATNSTGWVASITCMPVCQQVIAGIDSAMTQYHDSNYIDICFGDTITFMAKGYYPENNIVYSQSDLTSMFIWDFGDGTIDTGIVVDHYYNTVRGYNIQLYVTDVRGCYNMNAVGTRVRISIDPVGHIKSLPDICAGTTLDIDVGYSSMSAVNVTLPSFYQSASLLYDSATFVPDGGALGGLCYDTYVTFNCFNPGQTVQNASDIVAVRFNMEHSFVGDLSMKLVCPNGQQAILKEYIQSGGAYLGVPLGGTNHHSNDCSSPTSCVSDPLQNPPGIGWNYSFTFFAPQYNTMQSYATNGNATPPPPGGNNQIDSSSYLPFEPFTQLIGCPLNGIWNFQVCDYWASDNGWVFSWALDLDPSILPVNWGYCVPIDTVIWSGANITNTTSTTMTIQPDTGGTFMYNFQIVDDFGCSYDTSISIFVIDKPHFNLGPDTSLCENLGNPVVLTAPTYPLTTSYYWLPNGDTTQSITVNNSGEYIAIIMTGNENTVCDGADTINVQFWPRPLISFAPDDYEGCQPVTVNFTNGTTPAADYKWYFGDGDSSTDISPVHTYNDTGTYNVSLVAKTGEGCEESYTVNNLIQVYAQPKAEFVANPVNATVANAQITFTNNSTNYTNFFWLFGDGESSKEVNPVHVYKAKGFYDVWLYLATEQGCTDSVSMRISIIDDLLEIPNIITPNSDGKNDAFVIKNLDGYLSNELFIYDRWGKKVYYKLNYKNDWDGENHPDGTYFYVLHCKGLIQDQEITGSITVIGKQ